MYEVKSIISRTVSVNPSKLDRNRRNFERELNSALVVECKKVLFSKAARKLKNTSSL